VQAWLDDGKYIAGGGGIIQEVPRRMPEVQKWLDSPESWAEGSHTLCVWLCWALMCYWMRADWMLCNEDAATSFLAAQASLAVQGAEQA
jgi:hypothetical protein